MVSTVLKGNKIIFFFTKRNTRLTPKVDHIYLRSLKAKKLNLQHPVQHPVKH